MTVDARSLAAELADAERDGRWVPLLSDRFGDLDWATARAVALARDDLRRASGDTQVGYKLGWTSVAMREALGIERPNWGTLWASQLVAGHLDLRRLHQPKAEPELVAEIGEDATPVRWCLGIEIVNPRFASYGFDWLDNTADNSSCAHVALGAWVELDDDPAEVRVELDDGDSVRRGTGANVTGGPTASVGWLRDELTREGLALRPGDLVFTGGLTAPVDVVPGLELAVRSPSHPRLGSLSLAAV